MDYDLHDLLHKLGISELHTQKKLHWHYIDNADPAMGGHAEARLDNDDRDLSIDLVHRSRALDDEDYADGEERLETIRIRAQRQEDSTLYRLTEISFDGTDYAPDDDAMLQLCAGLFYARALHINEIMVNQRFKFGQTQFDTGAARLRDQYAAQHDRSAPSARNAPDLAGVIIPFRPRKDLAARRA